MHTLLTWTAYSLAGLFFVACVVAWYEHLGRSKRHSEDLDWESPLPKALTVDVELDALAAQAQSAGDVGERRAALGGALDRMARPDGAGRGKGFGDTAPMVLPGSAAAAPAERRQRDSASAD